MLVVFVLVALAWVTRRFLPEGALNQVNDASIAIAGVLALFVLPSGKQKGERLLDWENAVVFGSRAMTITDMARAGFALNVVTIVLTTLFVYFLLPIVMGIEIVQ